MKKYLLLTIFNFILLIIERSFLVEFFGPGATPSLILGLGFAFMFSESDDYATASMFIGGLLLDLLGHGIIGTTLLFMVLIIKLSLLLRKTVFKGWIFQFSMLFASVLLYKMIFYGFNFNITADLIYAASFTLVFSAGIYYIVHRFQHRYINSEYRIRA